MNCRLIHECRMNMSQTDCPPKRVPASRRSPLRYSSIGRHGTLSQRTRALSGEAPPLIGRAVLLEEKASLESHPHRHRTRAVCAIHRLGRRLQEWEAIAPKASTVEASPRGPFTAAADSPRATRSVPFRGSAVSRRRSTDDRSGFPPIRRNRWHAPSRSPLRAA